MRTAIATLLINMSVCGASPSAPKESSTPAPPTLRERLTVSPPAASPREPIGLVGRDSMMCAIRKDAPPACIGEIGLALEPADPSTDDGRYSRTHAERPVALDELDLASLEANDYARCVLDSDAVAQCWRRDVARHQGQFPEALPFRSVRDVAAEDQTCVVLTSGELRCTGDETCGGRNATPDYDISQVVTVPGIDTARIVAKALHMGCVIREDSTVACWGKTGENAECVPEAKAVPDLDDVVDIAVNSYSACGLRADNRVFCWGLNSRGALGSSEPLYSWTPLEVTDAHPAVKLQNTPDGFAVLRTDGSIVAWGGDLLSGEGSPPQRLPFEHPAVEMVALSGMVCALLDDGSIKCEGRKVRSAEAAGRPRPPFEGKTPWVEAPLYRLAPRPTH